MTTFNSLCLVKKAVKRLNISKEECKPFETNYYSVRFNNFKLDIKNQKTSLNIFSESFSL